MDEGESFSRRINVLSVPVRWTNQNEKTACCAHTPAAIFHHNENIIFLASIDCKLFLADANWFGRCTSKCPPTHSSHTRLLFPANSYYILVRTIDKIISFPFSSSAAPNESGIYMPLLETTFLCADRYNEYEPWTFFSALSHPTAAPNCGCGRTNISRKIYTILSLRFPSFHFSWVWKFNRKSVDFRRWFRFHVVSVRFYFVLAVFVVAIRPRRLILARLSLRVEFHSLWEWNKGEFGRLLEN